MSIKASFTLKGRNPDVLTCIANLSNDEVFTPPELANRMLDDLAAAWASSNDGKSIWSNKTIRFLDPCAKSGVFLREITKRLIEGLKDQIPNLQERTDHILSNQVYGIAITRLTSLLSRRSLYCSMRANGKHSVAKSLKSSSGNVWFERIEHTWEGTKCKHCDAPKVHLDRGNESENYAYGFLHTEDISKHITKIFERNMQFDVVIGNPPYQMKGGAGGSSDSSIYHLFIEQAIKLQPKYLSMVIPSRWMAGGRGMDEFRQRMLGSKNLATIVDYPVSREVFPNVEVKGGICYFLWSSHQNPHCTVTQIRGDVSKTSSRTLDEFDVFVREPIAVNVLKKVLAKDKLFMDQIVSNREPFKIESNFSGSSPTKKNGDIAVHRVDAGKRIIEWMPRKKIEKNPDLIDQWKVLVPKAGSDGGQKIPDSVLGKPWIAAPGSVCTGTFLAIPCATQSEAESIQSYYCTKFFRFLVSLRKITQDAFSHMYAWVPQQNWRNKYTDKELYKKYSLTADEIAYVESVIKAMDLSNDD